MKRLVLLIMILLVILAGCGTEEKREGTMLTFDSFDGGGPEYSIILDDPALVSYKMERDYGKQDHEVIDGAAYTVVFTFTGLKAGDTKMIVEERSPIAGNADHEYLVKVGDDLDVTIEELGVKDLDAAVESVPTLVIYANNKVFYATPEDNSSAEELVEKLSSEAIEVEMHDYGSFEKVGDLPWDLTTNDEEITTEPGDIILYQGDKITIYYGQNTWDFTRLAKIEGATREELLEALGDGDVTVSFWVEWSE